jgi:hypothetical protein
MKRGVFKKKKAQSTMSMPFGLIFSIFLIVVFIVVAFIAVKYFLNTGKCADVGLFYSNLAKQVDDIWRGSGADTSFKISLPAGITKVCFANMSNPITNNLDGSRIKGFDPDSNIFLLPKSETCNMGKNNIPHLDISKITKDRNPYCVSAKGSILIKKDVYDRLVSLS